MMNTTLTGKLDAGHAGILAAVLAVALAASARAEFVWSQDLVVNKADGAVTLGTDYKNFVNTSMTLHTNLTVYMSRTADKYYVNKLNDSTRIAGSAKIAIGPDEGDFATLEVRKATLESCVGNWLYADLVIGENGGNGRFWINRTEKYDYAGARVKTLTLAANAQTSADYFDTIQIGYVASLSVSTLCNQNAKPMKITIYGNSGFYGDGYLSSIDAALEAKLFSLPTAGGDIVVEGEKYAPVVFKSWSGWEYSVFDGTPVANLVFQGSCDVRFQAGNNGALKINGSNVIWNNTGDLWLYPYSTSATSKPVNVSASNWMPYGSQTGLVRVDYVPVDLNGCDQRVNGVIVSHGGSITSSGSAATMSVGDENGDGFLSGTFDDTTVNWVKSGAEGELVLSNVTMHALCVTGGIVRLAPNSVNAIGRFAVTNAFVEVLGLSSGTLDVTEWQKGDDVQVGYCLSTVGGVSNEVVTAFPTATNTTLYKKGSYLLHCVATNDAHGMELEVNGGALKMGGEATANKYWRMTFKKTMVGTYTYSDANDGYSKDVNLLLGGMGFFSADGFQVLPVWMSAQADGTAASALDENAVASEKPTYPMSTSVYKKLYPNTQRTADPICGGGSASDGIGVILSLGNSTRPYVNLWDVNGNPNDNTLWYQTGSGVIFANGELKPDDSSTWERIVWRLANTAKPCTSYSMACFVNNTGKNKPHPTDWLLESSPDGVTWTTMDERSGQDFSTTGFNPYFNYTYNDHIPYLFTARRANWRFDTFGPVSVAAGATLNLDEIPTENVAIRGLRIDMTAGAGTITKFVPAANGAIYLKNVPEGTFDRHRNEVPLTLGETHGTAALASWTVFIDGEAQTDMNVTYNATTEKLVIRKRLGMVLFLR